LRFCSQYLENGLRYLNKILQVYVYESIGSTYNVEIDFELTTSQYFDKKAVLSKGIRLLPQLFFSVQTSPTTFTTSLRVAKLRKPDFRAPNIPAQNKI